MQLLVNTAHASIPSYECRLNTNFSEGEIQYILPYYTAFRIPARIPCCLTDHNLYVIILQPARSFGKPINTGTKLLLGFLVQACY